MLLRFSTSNFCSVRDNQELTLVASTLRDGSAGLISAPQLRNEKILPAAVLYGANASGKSNFIKALEHMQELVRNSHRRGAPGEPIPLKPFLLDPGYEQRPSSFCAEFLQNDARYSYGFESTREEICTEYLYVWRGGPRTLLFKRQFQTFEFGRSLKGRNKVIEDLTRRNSLFLSAAAQNNHVELTEVASFFRSLSIDLANPTPTEFISISLANLGVSQKVVELLREIDIGVVDSAVHEEAPDEATIEMRMALFEAIEKKFENAPNLLEIKSRLAENDKRLRLGHRTSDGETKYFDLNDESAGTVQILSVLGLIFNALDRGTVAVIDEFGSRLHTRAAELILSLFNNKKTNPAGAQLIIATHDTNLLNSKGLRRDQVWFTEKDDLGATHLYPLTDIQTRKGDNLEKGYLQGRYGAIPFAGSLSHLTNTD